MPLPASPADAFVPFDGALYLDTASQAPRLRAVDAALHEAWARQAAPWRLTWAQWEADVERLRSQASRLFHVDAREDADGVALVPSVAHAMSMAAVNWPLRANEVVGIIDGEFPSALLPWQARCAAAGARLRAVAREDATQGFIELIERERPALLVLSQSHWRDGRLLDLDRVAMHARAHDVPVVLDLSQSLGVLPCDVARWAPAFAISVGYKWLLGGKGLGFAWVSPEWRERARPLERHWQGHAPVQPWRFEADAMAPHRAGARRFDGGEIADPMRLAIAQAGVSQVLEWTPAAIAGRLGELSARLRGRLVGAGVGDWCVAPASPHLLGLRPPAARLDALREAFARERIVCVERDGVFRIAPHLHVDEVDMDRVAEVVIGVA